MHPMYLAPAVQRRRDATSGVPRLRSLATVAALIASLLAPGCDRVTPSQPTAAQPAPADSTGATPPSAQGTEPVRGDTPSRTVEPGAPKGTVVGNPEVGATPDTTQPSDGATVLPPGTGAAAVQAGASKAAPAIDSRTNPGGMPAR